MNKSLYFVLLLVMMLMTTPAPGAALDRYNVTWDTPSANSSGSMPLGNGEIGLNVWVEPNGDLLFYIATTDAWSEIGRLLKLGRVRVRLEPNPFAGGAPFRQTLLLRQGEIEITGGQSDAQTTLRVWVDANQPVIHVEASGAPTTLRASLEMWRTEPREIKGDEIHSAYGLHEAPRPIIESGDTLVPQQPQRVTWFHRNPSSIWPETMQLQGLGQWMKTQSDPLLGRTFGAVMEGEGLTSENATTLKSAPRRAHRLSIYPFTAQTATPQEWQKRLDEQIARIAKTGVEEARQAHRAWWDGFWNRSWIRISDNTDSAAQIVTRGYILQRFMSACAGRGAFPIKFNGSLFTVDSREPGKPFDADYRLWGGPYWHQNTRLVYWPMLGSGDFEMMMPFFRMHSAALPLARERTRLFFDHGGAYIPETIYFWGTYVNTNYGWKREDKPLSYIDNRYLRHYYVGVLENATLMLDYFAHTGDQQFLRDTALPFAGAVIEFYDKHYPRDAAGRLEMKPAQSLETYHDVVNPTPDIAGLQAVLEALLALPQATPEQKSQWKRLHSELPPLPIGEKDGARVILPAQQINSEPKNVENPELYAVFPFRRYGVAQSNLEIARRSYEGRRVKSNSGWAQDEIQAAQLGLADEAKARLTARFGAKHKGSRFPAFWGPNYDWIPDQDHGNVGVMALQTMLLQSDGDTIRLFPAWPKEWDVEFKLHAPRNTIVEGVYRDGQVVRLQVTPAARMKDVVQLAPQ